MAKVLNQRITACSQSSFAAYVCTCSAVLLLDYLSTSGEACRHASNKQKDWEGSQYGCQIKLETELIPSRKPKELGIQRLTIISGKMCVQFGDNLYIHIYHIQNVLSIV